MTIEIDVFCDSADLSIMGGIVEQYPFIRGWTTNPSICRRCGVVDYKQFIQDALTKLPPLPLSVEVIADDPPEIYRQARYLDRLAQLHGRRDTLYVKIPAVNSKGVSLAPLIHELSQDGVQINATAVLSYESAELVADALAGGPPSWVSVFVGRLADRGTEPLDEMPRYVRRISQVTRTIWASPREPLNVLQAQKLSFDAITVFHDFIKKLHLFGKDLREFEIETSRMFLQDSISAGYAL